MIKQGFIFLHRSILDNPLFNCEEYSKGQAWVTILLLANHKEGYITCKNGEVVKIFRGECGYSELALADIFKWSRGKVKRFLNWLENEKMIQQKKRSDRNIISILNYENYQNNTTNDTTNSTTNGHQIVQQTDINNNDNNENNDNNDNNNHGKKSKKIDAYASKEVNEFIKLYENYNNSGRILNQTRLKIAQAIEVNGLDVMLEVIKKSANKGHLINNEFIPLSVENMLDNAQKILDDNYNLVDRQYKKFDINNMTNEDAEKLIFG